MLAYVPYVAAHAGHWIASMVYAAPAILLAAALAISTLRHRRGGRAGHGKHERRPPAS